MKTYYMEQRSPEWFAIKAGKVGASSASKIAEGGKALESFLLELMAEYYSSAPKERYTNAAMERGIELEPEARAAYEFDTWLKVKEIGFVEYNDYIGCSPDGLVGNDGLVEIKCPGSKVYMQYLMDGVVNRDYYWQMQMQMLICEKQWCDYVVYNPDFDRKIVIKRILRDERSCLKLLKGFEEVEHKIKEIKKKMEVK
jgi:putative phage-type endonuclease